VKVLARLPSREIDGADQVLPGVVAEVASGNQVRVWPAMTYDRQADQTRIAFFTEWRRRPTPEDERELIAYTDAFMGKAPALRTECHGDPTIQQENVDWLRTGKIPKPRRTN
jgi:hypothetical protein